MLKSLFTILGATAVFVSGEEMKVSVCNLAKMPTSLVGKAEAEASALFRAAGVDVVWASCGAETGPESTDVQSRFIVRLRQDRLRKTWGLVSLDAMGRAHIDLEGEGRTVDVFVGALREFESQHNTGIESLLGCVIVHEIGHLLLGPGHSARGIMQSPWRGSEAKSIAKGGLKFDPSQSRAIAQQLKAINSLAEAKK